MVKKITLFLLLLFNLSAIDFAQLVPGNETQVNFSGYFDSFNVSVIYPSISVTKKVSESTSLTARYLVDMITAASIKNGKSNSTTTNTSISKVDAVTAASGRTSGGAGSRYQSEDILPKFDEVRHEFLKFSSLILPATAVIGTINPFTKKIFAAEKNNDSFSLSVITDQPLEQFI